MLSFVHRLPLAFFVLIFVACHRDNYAPQGSSKITVVHAAPNTPDVDILIDGKNFTNTPLSYPDASYTYNVFLGNRTWQFNNGSNTIYTIPWQVPANTHQTLFLYDSASIVHHLILLNTSDPLPTGKAALRLVHLSADAPSVYLDLSGNAVCSNTAFKQSSLYTTFDAATLYFELRQTGTNALVKAIPDITLKAGKYYTLVVIGLVNGTGKKVLSLKLIEE